MKTAKMGVIVLLAGVLTGQASGADKPYWWQGFPSFVQSSEAKPIDDSAARMAIFGYGVDPTWGPYGQYLTELDNAKALAALKAKGLSCIAWIEGFGDCMLYAITFDQRADGTFAMRDDAPGVAAGRRSHWCWANRDIPQGNVFRWVGVHNTVNDEDFASPTFSRERLGIPAPTYPDGRPALGWIEGMTYPLNARVYDACGSKDINGHLAADYESPDKVSEIDPATGKPRGPVEGLYAAEVRPGTTVYAGVISVHKDLSAPFWREYVRHSIREMAKAGVDGVWCDNYSPWDNFGYNTTQKAFGDWSVYRFHKWLGDREPAGFDVRTYMKAKAAEFGARDPSKLDDPAWSDKRWLDDPVWGLYRAFRQRAAQEDLHAFYDAVHDEATKAGKPDFAICGNDIPFYGLGWVHDQWLDQVNTELTPGWHMGTGSKGLGLPPRGKMAIIYRLALEHQKAPMSAGWYYVDEPQQKKPELGKLLDTEAFANGAFLECDPGNPRVSGTIESHAWWNRFVREHEADFGLRKPEDDVGIVYSPDSQLAFLTPGGFADMDRQPHVFEYYGWATALTDEHVPYRVITDWKLDAEHLQGLRVLVLPNVEAMEAGAAEAVEKWVRGGGKLIIVGETGTREGPSGNFARKAKPLLAGVKAVRVKEPVGLDYYLTTERRASDATEMATIVGASGVARGSWLPATVGLTVWKAEGGAVFADLVNYDIDMVKDAMRPAEGLEVRVRVPEEWKTVDAMTMSPDGGEGAKVDVAKGWATVRVARLVHYASVKLTRGR